jgi:hypothetical protein
MYEWWLFVMLPFYPHSTLKERGKLLDLISQWSYVSSNKPYLKTKLDIKNDFYYFSHLRLIDSMSTNFFIIQGNTITDIAYFKNPWILVT